MGVLRFFAGTAMGFLFSTAAMASINLGNLSGNQIETFSYEPGPVDFVYNFTLTSASSIKVVESDFTLGGMLIAPLTLYSSVPDVSPPSTPSPTLLGTALAAIANINAELDSAIVLLQTFRQNGDDVGVNIQTLKIAEITNRRQNVIDLITELFNLPTGGPLPLRAFALAASDTDHSQELNDVLDAGSYSVRLAGSATGKGGGSLSFAVAPSGIDAGAVPESATWVMMVVAFGLIGGVMRRSRTPLAVWGFSTEPARL